jgi:hypothetical protein
MVKVGFRSGRGPAGASCLPASATERHALPDRSSQPTPGRLPPGRRAQRRENSPILLAGRASKVPRRGMPGHPFLAGRASKVPRRGAPDRTRPARDARLPVPPRAYPDDPFGRVKVGFRSGRGPAGAPWLPASATEGHGLPDRSSQPTPGRLSPGRRAQRRGKFAHFFSRSGFQGAPIGVRPTEHGRPGAPAYPRHLGP